MLTIEALPCSGAGHIQTVRLDMPLQAADGISRHTSPTTHKPGNKLSSDRLKGEVFGLKCGKLFFRSGHVRRKLPVPWIWALLGGGKHERLHLPTVRSSAAAAKRLLLLPQGRLQRVERKDVLGSSHSLCSNPSCAIY